MRNPHLKFIFLLIAVLVHAFQPARPVSAIQISIEITDDPARFSARRIIAGASIN